MKKKIMCVFGTRPEAIKMAPLVKEIEKDNRFTSTVVVTAQHREMLDQVLEIFSIIPDYDLDIMKKEQSLSEITINILNELDKIIRKEKPDILLVHGDTTTTFAAAVSAFYNKICIGHVEAGLRTWNKYSPYPEEMNRQLTDVLSDLFFAPTELSKKNLIKQGFDSKKIFVTGNTAIDAMAYTIKDNFEHELLKITENKKLILVTMHRRENLGDPMINVFSAINKILEKNNEVEIIFPMHRNPKIRQLIFEKLAKSSRVHLVEPLDVVTFQNLASRSHIILTDSGGIQEEAPSFGVPVLVLRDTTERPEGVEAGTLKLVGTCQNDVYKNLDDLLNNTEEYYRMSNAVNPYGDGTASKKILTVISEKMEEN